MLASESTTETGIFSPAFHSASVGVIETVADPNPTTTLCFFWLKSNDADLPLAAALAIFKLEASLSSYVPKTPVFGADSVNVIG